MKISIVVPARNEAGVIEKTLLSVMSQELDGSDELEIIVVVNDSTDDTAEVAKKVLNSSGRVVFENRRGANFARQKGFKESTGDIVCFVDADSWIPPRWASNVKEILQRGYAGVSGPYHYNFPELRLRVANWLFNWIVLPTLPDLLYVLYRKRAAVVLGGNFAATREALRKIGGIPTTDLKKGDDAVIAMLLARKAGRVAFSHKVWAVSSPRRYEEYGAKRVQKEYADAYFGAYHRID